MGCQLLLDGLGGTFAALCTMYRCFVAVEPSSCSRRSLSVSFSLPPSFPSLTSSLFFHRLLPSSSPPLPLRPPAQPLKPPPPSSLRPPIPLPPQLPLPPLNPLPSRPPSSPRTRQAEFTPSLRLYETLRSTTLAQEGAVLSSTTLERWWECLSLLELVSLSSFSRFSNA